jgi:hypothetical protein
MVSNAMALVVVTKRALSGLRELNHLPTQGFIRLFRVLGVAALGRERGNGFDFGTPFAIASFAVCPLAGIVRPFALGWHRVFQASGQHFPAGANGAPQLFSGLDADGDSGRSANFIN